MGTLRDKVYKKYEEIIFNSIEYGLDNNKNYILIADADIKNITSIRVIKIIGFSKKYDLDYKNEYVNTLLNKYSFLKSYSDKINNTTLAILSYLSEEIKDIEELDIKDIINLLTGMEGALVTSYKNLYKNNFEYMDNLIKKYKIINNLEN